MNDPASRDKTEKVTRILDQVDTGEAIASEELLELVYTDLRRLAAKRMSRQRPEPCVTSCSISSKPSEA